MQATRLTLMCHARTAAQKEARFGLDEPLDAGWLAKRPGIGGEYRNVRHLLCGPELRTRQTAALMGSEALAVQALADCDFGRWRGLSVEALLDTEPEHLQAWRDDPDAAPHGGESVTRLCRRVGDWLTTLQHTPGHCLAVTHPFVMRAALVHVLGCPMAMFHRIDIEPLGLIDLRFNDVWRLRAHGPAPETR